MKNKLVKIITAIVAVVFAGSLVAAPAFADGEDPFCNDNMGNAARSAMGCDDKDETDATDVIINIVNAVLGILGLVAVVFIIIGGVNYMTSNGDAAKLKKAKDTILYAVIGLVICALAFAIVNTVIRIINEGDKDEPSSKQIGTSQLA